MLINISSISDFMASEDIPKSVGESHLIGLLF